MSSVPGTSVAASVAGAPQQARQAEQAKRRKQRVDRHHEDHVELTERVEPADRPEVSESTHRHRNGDAPATAGGKLDVQG